MKVIILSVVATIAFSQATLASTSKLSLNAKSEINGVSAQRLYNKLENAKTYTNGSLVIRERLNGENGYVQCVKFTKNGTFECKVGSSVDIEVDSYGEIIKH